MIDSYVGRFKWRWFEHFNVIFYCEKIEHLWVKAKHSWNQTRWIEKQNEDVSQTLGCQVYLKWQKVKINKPKDVKILTKNKTKCVIQELTN